MENVNLFIVEFFVITGILLILIIAGVVQAFIDWVNDATTINRNPVIEYVMRLCGYRWYYVRYTPQKDLDKKDIYTAEVVILLLLFSIISAGCIVYWRVSIFFIWIIPAAFLARAIRRKTKRKQTEADE